MTISLALTSMMSCDSTLIATRRDASRLTESDRGADDALEPPIRLGEATTTTPVGLCKHEVLHGHETCRWVRL